MNEEINLEYSRRGKLIIAAIVILSIFVVGMLVKAQLKVNELRHEEVSATSVEAIVEVDVAEEVEVIAEKLTEIEEDTANFIECLSVILPNTTIEKVVWCYKQSHR